MAASWLTNVFNFAAGGTYNPAPTPIGVGSVGPLLCDQYGRLMTVPAAPIAGVSGGTSWYDSAGALQISAVVKASTATLYQAFGTNESASKVWVMIFDATALPGNGTAPKIQQAVQPYDRWGFDLSARGRAFTNGIVIAASTTSTTLTIVGAAALWINAEYV